MVIATQSALDTFSNDFPAPEHYLGQVWQFIFCEKFWVEFFLASILRNCSKIMTKSAAEAIFSHKRESYWNHTKTLSNTIWKIMAIVMTKRKILVDEFSTQNFSQNIFVYTCRKQCPCPGKSSGNAYNGFWVAITSKIHAFLLKNQGRSLSFHGFLCQNFPTVNPQQPPCLLRARENRCYENKSW